ncbi:MAG: LCP family protein [Anaerovoracaceae bacterium]
MSKATGKRRRIRLFPKGLPLKVVWIINFIVTIVFLALMTLVNAFPAKLTMYILAVISVMLVAGQTLICVRSVSRVPQIIGVLISVVYIAVLLTGSYYLYSTFSTFSRIGGNESANSGFDLTEEPYNIYFTGIDQWDTEKGKDLERSDVNMIATVNPVTKKILLTSIPRDAYVPLAKNGAMDKLTHTGIYGVDETINTVEGWLDIDLNYYVKVNFTGVCDVINAIGGIDVYSPESFVPEKYDTWTVKKGWNHMTGKKALSFARERHALKKGDASRVLNQQRVVKGIIRKLTTSTEVITSYTELLEVIDKHVGTNMTRSEMISLAKSEMLNLGGWEIKTQSLDGVYGQETVASLSSANKYSVFKVDEKSIDKCLAKMDAVMNPDEEEVNAILEKRYKEQQKSSIDSFISMLKNMVKKK